MPIRVFRNDITKVKTDAIVNSANPEPIIGGGAEAAIYEAAGKDLLLAERRKIGDIDPGEAFASPAFGLSAKYVIHTVGPIWVDGSKGEAAILRSCYETSLELAKSLGCKSIAFPFISTGTYGFPKDKAIEIAYSSINKFLKYNNMTVILVVYDKESFKISAKKFTDITAYIDEHFFDDKYNEKSINSASSVRRNSWLERELVNRFLHRDQTKVPDDVSEMVNKSAAGFSTRVQELVQQRGLKPSDIYDKDHILTKKIYSDMKIQGDDYKPKKGTAIAFCLALELDLTQAMELLGSAGWTLSDSKKIDLIVKWHIEKRIFSIRDINKSLNTFGFDTLDKYDK